MRVLFSVGDLGDPLEFKKDLEKMDKELTKSSEARPEVYTEEEIAQRNLRYELHMLANGRKPTKWSSLDDEIKRFETWRKGITDKMLEASEEAKLPHLIECRDEYIRFESALTNTLNKTTRSRLSLEAYELLKNKFEHYIKIVQDANAVIGRRIEALQKPGSVYADTLNVNQRSGPENTSQHLTYRQIALLYYYNGTAIKNNALEIARKHGYTKSSNSGDKLMAAVKVVVNDVDRRNGKLFKSDLEAILPLISSEEGKRKAQSEYDLA